ncbi:MAG: fumarylacetoacetate hydrolase family protein [Acidobacteriota bacterium]
MKWIRYLHEGREEFGFLKGGSVFGTQSTWKEVLENQPPTSSALLEAEQIHMLAPIPPPGKIVAIGLNYMDHCREQHVEPPQSPLIFAKFPTSVIGPGEAIEWSDQLTRQVDFEAELGVVIGKVARNVAKEDAMSCVLGYSAANDVSARDLQFGDGQWVRGKSLDTFCPLGPALVTVDELPDPHRLSIRSELNGVPMQESNTNQMIFSVGDLVAFCSRAFTLEAGDLILTGTPDGVGVFRDPKVFLQDGDTITVEIESVGRLENTCRVRSGGSRFHDPI